MKKLKNKVILILVRLGLITHKQSFLQIIFGYIVIGVLTVALFFGLALLFSKIHLGFTIKGWHIFLFIFSAVGLVQLIPTKENKTTILEKTDIVEDIPVVHKEDNSIDELCKEFDKMKIK